MSRDDLMKVLGPILVQDWAEIALLPSETSSSQLWGRLKVGIEPTAGGIAKKKPSACGELRAGLPYEILVSA